MSSKNKSIIFQLQRIKKFIEKGLSLILLLLLKISKKRYFNHYPIYLPDRVSDTFGRLTNVRYEPEEWKAVWHFGREGNCFLDIGANIGVITVAMSKVAGEKGEVISCEPNPKIYSLLLKVIKMNKCSNVMALEYVISDKCADIPFFISDSDTLEVSSSLIGNNREKKVMARSITIDELFEQGHAFDYIKIDAEGAELRILEGAEKTIFTLRPVIQVELHGQYLGKFSDSLESILIFVKAHSYDLINAVTWEEFEISDYLYCTHHHVYDPLTGEDLSFRGYGQAFFIPKEKRGIFQLPEVSPCKVCISANMPTGKVRLNR